MEEEDTGELGSSGTNPRRQVLQGCLMGQRQRDFGAKTAYPSIPTHFRSSTHKVHALSAGPQTHTQCAEAPATPTGSPAIISALTLKCRPPALPPEPWGYLEIPSWLLGISAGGYRKVSVTVVPGPTGGSRGHHEWL